MVILLPLRGKKINQRKNEKKQRNNKIKQRIKKINQRNKNEKQNSKKQSFCERLNIYYNIPKV